MTVQQILFFYFATVIVLLSLGAVTMRNPVYSVLMVLAMFFHMAGIYLTLNAEFLAAVQLVVYAGAVLVLYLFVVFLVNLKQEARITRFVKHPALGGVMSGALFLALLFAFGSFSLGPQGAWSVEAIEEVTFTRALAMELFTRYLLPFEVVGLILLIAVVGGIVLAKREESQEGDGRETAGCPTTRREA